MFKALYFKTINLAGHKSSKIFLGIMSFIESFVFPIPPDVLIIPMTIAKKQDWIKIALIATIGSVRAACLGYFIGYDFFNEYLVDKTISATTYPMQFTSKLKQEGSSITIYLELQEGSDCIIGIKHF